MLILHINPLYLFINAKFVKKNLAEYKKILLFFYGKKPFAWIKNFVKNSGASRVET